MKFLDQMDLAGKRLLIRVDYNVPLDGDIITDDNRITASLPTLEHALKQGASIILCAHLGKPRGKIVPKLTLRPVAAHLAKLLGREVALAPNCISPEVEAMAKALEPGQVMMLENLRFNAMEIGKNAQERGDFGQRLASLADIYVNDAFGVAHRKHASVVDVPKFAQACCGGFLLQREWTYLGQALSAPDRPFVAISGGVKVSSKLGVLNNLLGKVDDLIIGGAMANTFLVAQGHSMGRSLVEESLVDTAREILDTAKAKGTTLHLPLDFIFGTGIEATAAAGTCVCSEVPDEFMVLDIGPETIKMFCEVVKRAGTVVWNGPMGLFENQAFAAGSMELCKCLAGLENCVTIVGGGDTDSVVHHTGLAQDFTFISTGGGSFMEFLEGKELPAFKAIKEC